VMGERRSLTVIVDRESIRQPHHFLVGSDRSTWNQVVFERVIFRDVTVNGYHTFLDHKQVPYRHGASRCITAISINSVTTIPSRREKQQFSCLLSGVRHHDSKAGGTL